MTFFMFMYLLFRFAHGPSDAAVVAQAWYTTDDGKTWFADDIKRIPPFDKDGKSAVRAYVFKCPGGRPFISHLERYTPEGRKALEQMQRDPNSPINIEDVMLTGIEVKKPGSDAVKGWVKQSNSALAAKIMELKCPDGKVEGIEPVIPGESKKAH